MRHGITDWNAIHRFQGRTETSLSEAGLAQAEETARRLEGWPIDALYTSPLTRARQTADIIAASHRKHPIVLDDLTEVDFGSWEGTYYKKLLEKKDDSLLQWIADPFFRTPLGGEDWISIKSRAERVVNTVMESGHSHVAIISHGGIIRALLVAFLGLDPHTVWTIKVSNCSLTGIEVKEHETMLAFANDTLHLRDPLNGDRLPMW